jgi:acetylornithine deacetylase/succinyl-diaminopimelate desuccinylase-like protein
MTETQKLLLELIAIPSVNPALLRDQPKLTGEARVSEFISHLARQAGLDVDQEPVLPGRANLIVRLRPSGRPQQRILLAPHLDTVGGADPALFKPVTKQGRIYGRGACDTKGSVAAMLAAVLELARASERPKQTEVVFVGLVDEESCQAGSRAMAQAGWRANLAIVGEPTLLQVVTVHKGVVWLTVETRGKAAHGARPELGRSAVRAMAQVVDALEGDYARRLARRRHPLLGSATVNVGVIAGGRQANIVPDHCLIQIDRRMLPQETESGVTREIEQLLRRGRWDAGVRRTHPAPCWPLDTDAQLPLVQALLRATGQKKPGGVQFFSDAAVLAAGGIPSVLFGPGDIAQAHTEQEWVSIRQLDRAQAQLLRFLRSLA